MTAWLWLADRQEPHFRVETVTQTSPDRLRTLTVRKKAVVNPSDAVRAPSLPSSKQNWSDLGGC